MFQSNIEFRLRFSIFAMKFTEEQVMTFIKVLGCSFRPYPLLCFTKNNNHKSQIIVSTCILKILAMSSLTALESAFAFYASYHSDKTNQFIHILCVWPILITGQIFFTYTPPIFESNPLSNWSMIMSLIYFLYYFFIEQPGIAGPIASALVLGGFFFANKMHDLYPSCWKIALAIHVFCWVAQIYGHQAHEKRAPAFLDNLGQAFLMAPLFVLMEVMFQFGYKPEFQKKAFAIAKKSIAEFRSSNPKKR